MAVASRPLTFTGIIVAAGGVPASPGDPVPDNCHTILVYNPDSTTDAFVAIGAPGGAALTGTSAKRILPRSEVAFALGPITQRGIMDQSRIAGSGLIGDTLVVAGVILEVTYVNTVGVVG
jgi:hypothetical protein